MAIGVGRHSDDGILAAGCRPATLFQWIHQNVHGADRELGFCASGYSGGSGALSYAMAHYGLESAFDYIDLTAGPPFGRMDYGCAPDTYSGPMRQLCPELADAPMELPADKINTWEHSTTCGSRSVDPVELQRWRDHSVVSPGGDFNYPQTTMAFWNCATRPAGTAGGAYFYSQEISSDKRVACFTSCSGEPIGGEGNSAQRASMMAECIPRHR